MSPQDENRAVNFDDAETGNVVFWSHADTGDGYGVHSEPVSFISHSAPPSQDDDQIADLDDTDTGEVFFVPQMDAEDGRSLETELVRFIYHPTFPISPLPRMAIGLWISMTRRPDISLSGHEQT